MVRVRVKVKVRAGSDNYESIGRGKKVAAISRDSDGRLDGMTRDICYRLLERVDYGYLHRWYDVRMI